MSNQEDTRLARKLLHSEERKERFLSYLPSMPDYIPVEVIETARIFLDEGNWKHEEELRRILTHQQMKGFWHKLRLRFNRNPQNPKEHISLKYEWERFLSGCIHLMGWKGGKLPDMNDTEFQKARVGTAKEAGVLNDVHRLINRLRRPGSSYENIANLGIVDLIDLCIKSENQLIEEKGRSARGVIKKSDNAALAFWILNTTPSLLDLLLALQEQLEANQPLSLKDEWRPSINVPKNRNNAQRVYFRGNFLDELFRATGVNCWSLVAAAERAVFDLPEWDTFNKDTVEEWAKNKWGF